MWGREYPPLNGKTQIFKNYFKYFEKLSSGQSPWAINPHRINVRNTTILEELRKYYRKKWENKDKLMKFSHIASQKAKADYAPV